MGYRVVVFFWALAAQAQTGPALLVNGGFEDGLAHWQPGGWRLEADRAVLSADAATRRTQRRSARIQHSQVDDTFLKQEISAEPETVYKISGWIKTKEVSGTEGPVAASIAIDGSWVHSPDVRGTQDWQLRSLWVRTGAGQRRLGVLCRLGFWSSAVKGTAWFDDISVEKVARIPAGADVQTLGDQPPGKAPPPDPAPTGYWIAVLALIGVVVGLSFFLRRLERGRP